MGYYEPVKDCLEAGRNQRFCAGAESAAKTTDTLRKEIERWKVDSTALYAQKKENEAKIRALEEALLVSLGKGNATFWTRVKWVFKKP